MYHPLSLHNNNLLPGYAIIYLFIQLVNVLAVSIFLWDCDKQCPLWFCFICLGSARDWTHGFAHTREMLSLCVTPPALYRSFCGLMFSFLFTKYLGIKYWVMDYEYGLVVECWPGRPRALVSVSRTTEGVGGWGKHGDGGSWENLLT